MDYRFEGKALVIDLSGRIDATNAADLSEQLDSVVSKTGASDVTLDAGGLEYISSAGLRALVKLVKRLDSLAITEVSPEVYDVFEMTGLTQLMSVRRALRTISVEGCELIGQGGNGAVYRLDAETIVKVYHTKLATLDWIQASRASAQKLLAAGIPVAIAYDVVHVGDGYGLVYELLDCKTVGESIHEDPSTCTHWAREAAKLLKQLHTTEVPWGTFPDARDSGHRWVEVAKDVLSADEQARLHRLFDAMPVKNTLVHGDFHPGNMMVQDGEIILIDTDDVAQGDPIIDMAGIALTLENISTDEQAMAVVGLSVDEARRYWDAFLREYYGTDDEATLERVALQRKPYTLVKLLYGLSKTTSVSQQVKEQVIPPIRDGLMQLLDAVGMQ